MMPRLAIILMFTVLFGVVGILISVPSSPGILFRSLALGAPPRSSTRMATRRPRSSFKSTRLGGS